MSENDLRSGKITFSDPMCTTKKNKNTDPIRLKIAKRALQELHHGMYINLGIGISSIIPTILPEGLDINLHSENGVIGVGPYPTLEKATGRNINASKVRVFIVSKP